jgi:hypothetical protein
MESHVHAPGFGLDTLTVDYDLVHFGDALAQCGALAVNLDPTLLNEPVGLAP